MSLAVVRDLREARAAAGPEELAAFVSVGKSSGTDVPDRAFQGLRSQFTYTEAARREGVIIEIEDLAGFADDVRRVLLKGIE